MKNSLVWKLLLTNILPVILVIIFVIWLAIDNLAADYFMVLMDKYSISPKEVHDMFLTSIHYYLIWASVAALFIAIILSFVLTRRVLKPLSEMARISERYGAGDFSSRVAVSTTDEVGELGRAFNQMADNLEKVEQLRKNMVADAAHELRTPLTNLCGYLEALKDKVLPPAPETLTLLHQESLHLTRLVEGLQQLARADAAKSFLHWSSVDPVKEMKQLHKLYHHRFQNKRLSVQTDYAPCCSIQADKDKLLQALRNLFENCWKYTPEKGEVTLAVHAKEDRLYFTFTNSGPVIDEEDLPYIFERFFRTDRSRSRQAGGFGLGLAITKELIEAQGGMVGARSNHNRTTIWIALPIR